MCLQLSACSTRRISRACYALQSQFGDMPGRAPRLPADSSGPPLPPGSGTST